MADTMRIRREVSRASVCWMSPIELRMLFKSAARVWINAAVCV